MDRAVFLFVSAANDDYRSRGHGPIGTLLQKVRIESLVLSMNLQERSKLNPLLNSNFTGHVNSSHVHSAVYIQGVTCNVTGPFRCQKSDGVGYFNVGSYSPQRDELCIGGLLLFS
jgi:hypothetical protein